MIYDGLVELQDDGGISEEYTITVDRRNHSISTTGFFLECRNVNPIYQNIRYGFHEFVTVYDLGLALTNRYYSPYQANMSDSELTGMDFDLGREVFSSSNSPQRFSLASNWLSDCLRNHHRYRKVPRKSLPRRLVPIRGEEAPFQLSVCHVVTNYDLDYVALSYCWDGKVNTSKQREQIFIPISRIYRGL